MQWQRGHHGGFSDGKPWLPVGESLPRRNVEAELHEADSFLSLYRRLLRLRSHHEILRRGTYEVSNESPKDVFMYSRWLGDQHVYVALNFSSRTTVVKLPHDGRVLCCTHPVDYPDIDADGCVVLRPREGVLVECQEHPLEHR